MYYGIFLYYTNTFNPKPKEIAMIKFIIAFFLGII